MGNARQWRCIWKGRSFVMRVQASLESESSVLGGLLLDNNAWDRVSDVAVPVATAWWPAGGARLERGLGPAEQTLANWSKFMTCEGYTIGALRVLPHGEHAKCNCGLHISSKVVADEGC